MFVRNNRAKEEREERMRLTHEAELISARFPGVSRIVIKMQYMNQKVSSMRRTLNFRPGSHAYFKLTCLGEGCVDGGLDMTRIIRRTIRGHEKAAKGHIRCQNIDPAALHADISYYVSIQYT